ncbi:hypothetical protein OKA04_16335 [Luteolibacter flavescens]|uniref:Uncharacterized protein n=1 Tax=Luteolibacter flavescens TaxID=1859460 RepID=A0ABT3FRY0_9BACT|nr:hypothetical protein [Luteolibacter flavescens]MCW1886307.1 hypothetical protein [Luteolibacter flavescens]
MRPPLHRWISFWLGLFVIVFVGWAWWDSHRYYSTLIWVGKGFAWNGAGMAGISRNDFLAPDSFEFAVSRAPLGTVWLPGIRAKFPTFAVAHWAVMLSFALPWFRWLAWRWHRLGKLQAEAPPDDGSR